MKKTLTIVLAVGLLVALMATAALAAGPGDGVRDLIQAGDRSGHAYAWGFVDEDGDGVNDRFVDANGDGICDTYVDEDGDGVNDLAGTQAGMGRGQSDGTGFVDADGDGLCDNSGAGSHGTNRGGHGGNR